MPRSTIGYPTRKNAASKSNSRTMDIVRPRSAADTPESVVVSVVSTWISFGISCLESIRVTSICSAKMVDVQSRPVKWTQSPMPTVIDVMDRLNDNT